MADLKIPNLAKKTDKYLFKKKLSLRRKSKKMLLGESFLMFILSILFALISYLIPNKDFLFKNFFNIFEKTLYITLELLANFFQIFLVILIFVSLAISIILLLGSFYRIVKVLRRKTKFISYN